MHSLRLNTSVTGTPSRCHDDRQPVRWREPTAADRTASVICPIVAMKGNVVAFRYDPTPERWHLHELDPGWTAPTKLQRHSAFDKVQAHLSDHNDGAMVRRLALRLVEHLRLLTEEIDELTAEITVRVTRIAPSLLAIVGCGALSAAKIIGETAHAGRFRSKDAFARHNGTAPLPVWSSNKQRHRMSRTGNRQLNAALHRIALTQARCYPPAGEMLERRTNSGDGGMEALRILKRRLSDVVYRAMLTDETGPLPRTA
jgi:transposase